jgi:hypothetical protein
MAVALRFFSLMQEEQLLLLLADLHHRLPMTGGDEALSSNKRRPRGTAIRGSRIIFIAPWLRLK